MDLTFRIGGDVIIVRIRGHDILFSDSNAGYLRFYPIDCLKLNILGILKEFPDLKGLSDGDIRQEAIKRFKKHIADLDNENKIKDYIILELGNIGYQLIGIKREGFREIKIK